MTETPLMPSANEAGSFKMFRAMVGIGIACALAIVATYQLTLPVITANKAEALEKAIFNVLPGAATRVNYRWNGRRFEKISPDIHGRDVIYVGLDKDNQLIGIAVEAGGQGFQDAIQLLYGFDPYKQHIVGFQVLESRETPGLGDKIDKDAAFKANFNALDARLNDESTRLAHPIVTVKHGAKTHPWEVDAITGATISSKAVGVILNNSVQYWAPLIHQHLDELKE
ncbi:MAG: FMN-binding protein [Calditrichaeota bacterium]|nr:MAG: FMN-binding protein [Calditrichota bacterium]